MAVHRLVFPLALLTCSLLLIATEAQPSPRPRPSLAVMRLSSNDMMDCWDSLIELRACTSEVILFFLNGETYLGSSCCHAIRVIEHRCWPAMLTSLGFSPDEGDVLTGYCDASDHGDDRRAPPLLPPAPPSLGPATSPGTAGRA